MASVDSLVCGTRMPPPPTGIRGPTQHLARQQRLAGHDDDHRSKKMRTLPLMVMTLASQIDPFRSSSNRVISAARHAGLRGGEQRVSQRHWGTYYPCGILGSEAPAQPLTGAIWLCGYAAVVRWTLLGPLRSADPRCCTSGGFTGSQRCYAPVAPPI